MPIHKPSWVHALECATASRNSDQAGLELAQPSQEKIPQYDVSPISPDLPVKGVTLPAQYVFRKHTFPKTTSISTAPPAIVPDDRICGLRKSRFWLLVALTCITIAAIIAASVAGTLISRRNRAPDDAGNNESASFVESSSTDTSSTSSATSPLPTTSSTLIIPTSDCSRLNSSATYVLPANPDSSLPRDVQFKVKCNSDSNLPLIMALRAYKFEDCMQACATHATNSKDMKTACVTAVYKPNSGQSITCWLMSNGTNTATGDAPGVDTARILGD
ncbi:MAG: hypothetical protein Q9174_006087 [Haloplaca sp. 1 TL-2023]